VGNFGKVSQLENSPIDCKRGRTGQVDYRKCVENLNQPAQFQIVVKHRGVIFKAAMNGQYRKNVRAGVEVDVILKKDQGSGRLTRGIVKDILTRSSFHPHGIKVRLVSGDVGRVQAVFE
jgi:uncharacterized repeat protein (TIGR03833 family)